MRAVHLLLLLLLCHPLWADEASHRAKARALLDINGSAEIVSSTLQTLERGVAQYGDALYEDLVTNNFDDPSIHGRILQFERDATNVIRQEFSYENWLAEFVPLWMANFSEAELEQLIAFYSSDVGQAMVTRLPSIMQQSAEIGETLNRRYTEAIEPLERQLYRDLGLEQ